jgi:hypothetical protein
VIALADLLPAFGGQPRILAMTMEMSLIAFAAVVREMASTVDGRTLNEAATC